jgi:hypothetical protein
VAVAAEVLTMLAVVAVVHQVKAHQTQAAAAVHKMLVVLDKQIAILEQHYKVAMEIILVVKELAVQVAEVILVVVPAVQDNKTVAVAAQVQVT